MNSQEKMTQKELAKLLGGIDTKYIHQEDDNSKLFEIGDATIGEIDPTIWEKDLSLEFWRCSFEKNIVFPSKTNNKKICARIIFQDCNFYAFVNARNSVFEKEFECNFCVLKEKIDFSKAEFKQSISFKTSCFQNEARFVKTRFNAKIFDDKNVENNFRETHFEEQVSFDSAVFSGRVDFSISRFKNEARFIKTRFEAKTSDDKKAENNFQETHFEGQASFSSAIFAGRVDFSISRFKNEARFIKTRFEAQSFKTDSIENNFQETHFEGKVNFSSAIFAGRVDFSISRFKNEARFVKTRFEAQSFKQDSKENIFKGTHFDGKASFDSAIFAGRVDFSISRFKNEARFIKTQFEAKTFDDKNMENNFRETHFDGKASFDSAIFAGRVDFSISRFKNEARFIKTQFEAKTFDDKSVANCFDETQFEIVFFNVINFKGRISFKKNNFKKSIFKTVEFHQKEVSFWETIFEKVTFIDCCFPLQTIFNKCTFKNTLFQNENDNKTMFQEVEFQDCVFKEANTFGENVFPSESKPRLTTNTFEGQFNIKQCFLNYTYEQIEEDDLSAWRDLFRRLKSNRLAHHNIIDASELHTQELYARERELKQKENQGNITFKEKIEKWQLWFYRFTSDHHTDLAKIFNNVILLIALFGMFSIMTFRSNSDNLAYNGQIYDKSFQHTYTIILEKHKASNINFLSNSTESSTKQIFCIIHSCFKFGSFCSLYTILIAGILLITICFSPYRKIMFFILGLLISGYLTFNKGGELLAIFILDISFILTYLLLLSFQELGRQIVLLLSYIAILCILITKPVLLLPFVGKLFYEGLQANFPAMQSLSVVYCILMFLMLFSLQKTARKNSIIPS